MRVSYFAIGLPSIIGGLIALTEHDNRFADITGGFALGTGFAFWVVGFANWALGQEDTVHVRPSHDPDRDYNLGVADTDLHTPEEARG